MGRIIADGYWGTIFVPPVGQSGPVVVVPTPDAYPFDVTDDYTIEGEISREPTEDELLEFAFELASLDSEDDARYLAARDPRIRHGDGVDGHLARALSCGACRNAPRDSRRQPARACALRCWQSNNAIDIMAPVGYAVRAVRAGYVDPNLGYGLMARSGGTAGYRVHVRHPDGMISWYQHMGAKIIPRFTAGQPTRIQQGTVVGYVGRWPDFAPHCHFAVTPPHDPESFWELVVSRTGRERATPQPPGGAGTQTPTPWPKPKVGTMEDAWADLMTAQSTGKRDAQRSLAASRRMIRETIR